MNAEFAGLGFSPADVLLPSGQDMEKWSVVACDQFTSEPEYWRSAEELVGAEPSTLRLILPEAGLRAPDVDEKIAAINRTMDEYLASGVFREMKDALIYVERTQSDGRVRRGVVGKIDLEDYDYTPGSGALIRATEGTVLERIPPRVRVREHAALELPHVMLLIDDPDRTVIEPLAAQSAEMETLYDFPLMLGGGHVRGLLLKKEQQTALAHSLRALSSQGEMARKYDLPNAAPLLFAVGDGNHSLATAKACYENLKKVTPPEQWASLPARYALVEIVNNHDDALQFEPIHRVLFHVDAQDFFAALREVYPDAHEGKGAGHVLECYDAAGTVFYTIPHPAAQLAVGTLQAFLDGYLADHPACSVDYIHGDDTARTLGRAAGNLAILLPPMGKEQLFKTVMADGVLPRKTFSMGHAQDKRYYLEARRIR